MSQENSAKAQAILEAAIKERALKNDPKNMYKTTATAILEAIEQGRLPNDANVIMRVTTLAERAPTETVDLLEALPVVFQTKKYTAAAVMGEIAIKNKQK